MQSMKSLSKQCIFYVESKLFQLRESIESLEKKPRLLTTKDIFCVWPIRVSLESEPENQIPIFLTKRKERELGKKQEG